MRPILVIDDNPDALALTQHALACAGVKARLDVVQDSRRAIAYLKGRLARGEQTLPLLTFLDLEMPGSGLEVLQWIRRQPRLRRMLRVVLRSSLPRRDGTPAAASSSAVPSASLRAAPGIRTIFQLANAVLSVDEIEALVLSGLPATVEAAP